MQKNTNIYHIAGITDLYKDQLITKLKKLSKEAKAILKTFK